MCLRIRQERHELEGSGTTLTPPATDRMRPRLAGALAAVLVAGLATAALVAPSSRQATIPPIQQHAAPAVPIEQKTLTPAASQDVSVAPFTVIEQITLSGDDGVPTNTDLAKTAAGGCAHEL